MEVSPDQPFLLNVWEALARITGDLDHSLPSLLKDGVRTGILTSIPLSGAWAPIEVGHGIEQTLLVHCEPCGSALKSLELTWSLTQKDLSAGHLFELHGGEEEARARFGTNVAAGQFGVVCAEGRKPRLIGDGRVSGTKDGSQISEQVRLPNLNLFTGSYRPAQAQVRPLGLGMPGGHTS